MARFYVKKDNEFDTEWNVFSTVVDDFLYSKFMSFDELKALVIGELIVAKYKELDTLLTSRPQLNTMSYEDAVERVKRRAQTGFCEFKGSMCETCEIQTECPWK